MKTLHGRMTRWMPFLVHSRWFSGDCNITTYELNELLGTKMRALYQRKKGRDLYDLGYALTHTQVDDNAVLQCFEKYMSFVVDHVPTYKEYVLNLDEKMNDKDFLTDMNALLHPDLTYDPHESYLLVKERLIDKLPGDRWH